MQEDPRAWEQIQRTQEEWSRNPPAKGTSATVIADITDGSVFRDHPEFGQNLRLGKEGEPFQLGIGLYYDGVETANVLGYARGKHSIGCIYICLINLDKAIRMSRPYIMPVTIVLESDMRRYGAAMVLSGANSTTGEILPSHWSSFGAQMRQLHEYNGVEWDVPVVLGGIRKQAFRAHLLVVCADFPAKGKLTPCAESTSAAIPSIGSNWDHTDPDAYKPFSFLRTVNLEGKPISNRWKLRTLAQVESDIQTATSKLKMQLAGLQKKVYALQPSLVPLADFTVMAPEDPMHGEPDGNLRRSGYRTIYNMGRAWGVTCEQVNGAIRSYNWPPGDRPPDLHESIMKGAKGGMPDPDGKWRYSASQGLKFSKHSVAMLQNAGLVRDTEAPFWKCWVKHVEYINILLQDEFTQQDILTLDRKVYEYQEAVDKVYPGYKKPKDAFSFMYAINILRNGPPKCYWCMSFEAFNQVCKRIVEASNYKIVCKRVLEVWALRSARHLRSGKVTDWGETVPRYLGHRGPISVTKDTATEVVARLFGSVFSTSDHIQLHELHSVYHLGSEFEASNWVIHEALTVGNLPPALAEIKSLFEVTHNSKQYIFVHLLRYLDASLEASAGAACGVRISGDDLASSAKQDIICYLPRQLITALHHNYHVGSHSFMYM